MYTFLMILLSIEVAMFVLLFIAHLIGWCNTPKEVRYTLMEMLEVASSTVGFFAIINIVIACLAILIAYYTLPITIPSAIALVLIHHQIGYFLTFFVFLLCVIACFLVWRIAHDIIADWVEKQLNDIFKNII